MLLSVIIPVYKVENTLDRCVESVLRQNVEQMEIILVDDGSPDCCGEMCDAWAFKDARIRVIHKRNGGLSSARNAGIDIAQGKYITFVDSDDYILPDTYSKLMSKLSVSSEIDILEYSIIKENNERKHQQFEESKFSSARQYWIFTKAWNHSYVCNKIYRSELFDNARFETGKIFEDILIMPLLLSKAVHVATTMIEGYIYSVNENGISSNVSIKSCYSLLVAEIKATWRMKTMPWGNGLNLYYMMVCRMYDIIRLSL